MNFFEVAGFDVSNQQGPGCEPEPYNAELQQWREETVQLSFVFHPIKYLRRLHPGRISIGMSVYRRKFSA